MSNSFLLQLSALIALLPASLAVLRKPAARDAVYWFLLAVAISGPGLLLIVNSADGWQTDLSTSLWVTITTSLILFAIVSALVRDAWRLGSLFAPYMFLLGLFAIAWGNAAPGAGIILSPSVSGWVALHIIVSVITYGLVTIAAVAALAAILQERALKAKQPTALTHILPPLTDCDQMVVRLLVMGEAVLALGLLSGMALQILDSGTLFSLNHKTILSLTAFAVIGCLLFAHFKSGLRGRKAARLVLLGYLLLTLGYPGVKFVTDVLLAG